MVGYGEWSCKYGAGLSVLSVAVCKKERICSRVAMCQFTGLPNKTSGNHSVTNYAWAALNDKVLCNNSAANYARGLQVAVYAAIVQKVRAHNCSPLANLYIGNAAATADSYPLADSATFRSIFFCIVIGYVWELLVQGRAMAVECHNVGNMRAEAVCYNNLSSTGLAQYTNSGAIAKTAFTQNSKQPNILNKHIVRNIVICYIFPYIRDIAVIAHCNVVQPCIVYSAMQLYHII